MILASRFLLLVLLALLVGVPAPVRAQAPAQEIFLEVSLSPAKGTYLVLESVNIRKSPSPGAERLGGFKKGEKIKVFARANADWLAVMKDGKKFGFVYEPALREIITEKVDADFSIPLSPASGTFMALKNVNIRAKPETGSKRVTRLAKGEHVEVIGRPKDAAWLAVKRDGKKLGYVYAPVMLPLIDGSLKKIAEGKIAAGKSAMECSFAIRFDSRNPTENSIFSTFDYDISFDCSGAAGKLSFLAFMFITEAPYDSSSKQAYQINVDVLGVGEMFDEPVSAIFIYKRKKGKVVFDSVSQKEFSSPPDILEKPAENVRQALVGAVEMAVVSWNKKLWQALAKASP